MLIVALLSQYNLMESFESYPSSFNRIFSHSILHNPWAMALNSVSTLDLATTNCFLLRQVAKFPLANVQYSKVERRSTIDPTQATFV
jgi:hypothetical protein